jgi:glycosyltransferase involved in cell wall biosynthesis
VLEPKRASVANVNEQREPFERFCMNLNIGILPRGGPEWIAGVLYIQNLIRAINLLSAKERPELYFVVSSSDSIDLYRDLGKWLPPLKRYAFRKGESLGSKIAGTVRQIRRFQHAISLEHLTNSLNLSALFPVVQSLGTEASCKRIGWIPDFQHKHLPQFFSTGELRGRDLEFQRIIQDSAHTVVSSRYAYEDLMRWFPTAAARVSVFPFVSVPSGAWYEANPEEVVVRYKVPGKYLIFPSQFWIHKNHQRLFEAVRMVKRRFPDFALVCTGRMEDYRHPEYGQQLLSTIKNYGLEKNVYCLGFLDRLTQIQLLRASAGVVQPSLFEGWSALVEDARALGKPLYLSDIRIHREQDPPDAQFFDPMSPSELAALLERDWEALSPGPDLTREKLVFPQQERRAIDYARSFLAIVRETCKTC